MITLFVFAYVTLCSIGSQTGDGLFKKKKKICFFGHPTELSLNLYSVDHIYLGRHLCA